MSIEPSKNDRELADRILASLHNSNEMDHVAAAKVIAEWNTRPQPAPPEGEPDFGSVADEAMNDDGSLRAVFIRYFRRMYRLGLSARPKAEGEKIAVIARGLRNIGAPTAADLLERLADKIASLNRALSQAHWDAEVAEAKLAEREAELAKARDTIKKIATICKYAAYGTLAMQARDVAQAFLTSAPVTPSAEPDQTSQQTEKEKL